MTYILYFESIKNIKIHKASNSITIFLQKSTKNIQLLYFFFTSYLRQLNQNSSNSLLESLKYTSLILNAFDVSLIKDIQMLSLTEKKTFIEYNESLQKFLEESENPIRIFRFRYENGSLNCFQININKYYLSLLSKTPNDFAIETINCMFSDFYSINTNSYEFFSNFINNSFLSLYFNKPKVPINIQIKINNQLTNANLCLHAINYVNFEQIEIAVIEKLELKTTILKKEEEKQQIIEEEKKSINFPQDEIEFFKNFYPEQYQLHYKDAYYKENQKNVCSYKEISQKK